MREVTVEPMNAAHFARLISFAQEVLGACAQIGVSPVLDGSLAVLAYTGDPSMEVHDIDFSCPESQFPQLLQAFASLGIECRIRSWHVLQARRGDLKIELGATEHWNQGIPDRHESVKVGDVQFPMVSLDGLRELYRLGLIDTAGKDDDSNRKKHRTYEEKLRLLGSPEG